MCGRYEGFDQRVHEHLANDEISIGRYVLSGGEIPAMAVVDAVCRKLPGALGKEQSHLVESFSPELDGGLEYPHYTRPEEFRGWTVPEVLLSGHHGEIEALAETPLTGALRAERRCTASLVPFLGFRRRGRPAVTVIQDIENRQRREVPQFKAGDTVRVHFKVIEGTRSRVQVFEGICIKRQGEGVRETFTVRKKSFNEVFVERTFPVHSPRIEKIDVASIGDVSRAKLYYLRDKVGKAARVREKSR